MKIGDLVKSKVAIFGPVGEDHRDKAIGLVIKSRHGLLDLGYMSYEVQWSGDYGTFWSDVRDLELINESR